jgi:hypothetical protein
MGSKLLSAERGARQRPRPYKSIVKRSGELYNSVALAWEQEGVAFTRDLAKARRALEDEVRKEIARDPKAKAAIEGAIVEGIPQDSASRRSWSATANPQRFLEAALWGADEQVRRGEILGIVVIDREDLTTQAQVDPAKIAEVQEVVVDRVLVEARPRRPRGRKVEFLYPPVSGCPNPKNELEGALKESRTAAFQWLKENSDFDEPGDWTVRVFFGGYPWPFLPPSSAHQYLDSHGLGGESLGLAVALALLRAFDSASETNPTGAEGWMIATGHCLANGLIKPVSIKGKDLAARLIDIPLVLSEDSARPKNFPRSWEFVADLKQAAGVAGITAGKPQIASPRMSMKDSRTSTPGTRVAPLVPAQNTSRAWAHLDARAGCRYRFLVTKAGSVTGKVDVAPTGQFVSLQQDGASLAMAPDGSLLAILARRLLRISVATPSNGTLHEWAEPIRLPYENVRVLAIARKGDREVWCAIAAGATTRVTSLAKSGEQNPWREVGDATERSYAAFVGTRLLFIEGGQIWQVFLPDGEKQLWTPPNWDQSGRTVIALDSAEIGGQPVKAVLTETKRRRQDEHDENIQLTMVPTTGETNERELEPLANHVSVVRAPTGTREEMCVFAGSGIEMKPSYPFQVSE